MAAFPSRAQSSDRMAPIQKKWNPEMESRDGQSRDGGRERMGETERGGKPAPNSSNPDEPGLMGFPVK